MALDEALLDAYRCGLSHMPTLRFYEWRPRAISLGYSQVIDEVLDRAACRDAGVDIVRRSTGGRAVCHDRELTYCLVAGAENPVFGDNVKASYAAICRALMTGLKKLGVEAQFADRRRSRGNKQAFGRNEVCFLSPSWYEVMVEGRKLIGSAQRRKKGFVMQQGSLVLGGGGDFWNLFRLSGAQRERLPREWERRTVALWDLIPPLPLARLKDVLVEGFEETLSVRVAPGELTDGEIALARELEGKYRSWEWNEGGA